MDSDLKQCVDALAVKKEDRTINWRYYDGDHVIAFTNERIRQAIKNATPFVLNWCSSIVDASRDRMTVQSWQHEDGESQQEMLDIWRRALKSEMHQIHLSALVTGEAYIVAWGDEGGRPCAYYHDPRQAHMLYCDDNPRKPRCACKTWDSGDKTLLNLYYEDRIEHYYAQKSDMAKTADSYKPYEEDGHPAIEPNQYGVIPVFRFALDRRTCTGEITKGVRSAQDAINKLLCDMMVSSEYGAFPQRWAIGSFDDGAKFPVNPGSTLKFPAAAQGDQNTEIGAFPSVDPSQYLKPMSELRDSLAIISRTPKHYFMGGGGQMSGEALQAEEAPLVSKVESYQDMLGDTWTDLMVFCCTVAGSAVNREDIRLVWHTPYTNQPLSEAQTRKTNAEAGIPIITQLRDAGMTDAELDQVRADMEEAAALSMKSQPPTVGVTGLHALPPERKTVIKEQQAAKAVKTTEQALADMGNVSDADVAKIMDKFAGKQVKK